MDNNTYVHILLNTLIKKDNILDKLIEITMLQEECITTIPLDIDKFEETLPEKELMIEQLNQIDDGFEKVYDHVKDEINTNKIQYKDEIVQLQLLIKHVTDKSVKLQATEIKNKNKLEVYFSSKKKEIKDYKMSSKTASNYYKNMASQHSGESYFLDKKN